MKEQITLWIDKDLLEKVRKYAAETTESKKALSGTISKILREKIEKEDKTPPIHADSTHTHKTAKGVGDVLEWIEENNPKGITKDRITQAIKDLKGYDIRTVQKYEPIVLQKIQENGFKQHPNNPNLFIRYEL